MTATTRCPLLGGAGTAADWKSYIRLVNDTTLDAIHAGVDPDTEADLLEETRLAHAAWWRAAGIEDLTAMCDATLTRVAPTTWETP